MLRVCYTVLKERDFYMRYVHTKKVKISLNFINGSFRIFFIKRLFY